MIIYGVIVLYETAYNLSHVLPEQSSDGAIYLVPASVKANDILAFSGKATTRRDCWMDSLR